MRDPVINPNENKQSHHEECCDLYGEYCYPCNTGIEVANRKEGEKKAVKGKKRRAG